MSKEIYVVNCYTCQHNGQETCKGCNTLLNGDVEPYENWELREDLSQKDQRIAELEQELAELKEKAIVPRFRIGQEIWYVGCSSIQSWIVNRIELDYMVNDKLCEIYRLGHYGTDDYSCCIMPFDSDRYFATEQEAQAKLKEVNGNV